MVRPFRFGDIFLIQRLGRQATKLNIVQATLHRQSAFEASLTSVIPWNQGKYTTYILRQRGHHLARDGFLQVQKRPGRPELDIVRLAPGLDARRGHPAIWEKLLSHHTYEAARRGIERIYADVPDQPLPVNTFAHAGFRTYDRQTLWRLTPQVLEERTGLITSHFRPMARVDEWALEQLYRRAVPEAVQAAEGMQDAGSVCAPILGWWQGGSYATYVQVEQGEVRGAVQIVHGSRGNWLQPWCDFTDPDTSGMHQLVRFALTTVGRQSARLPVYVAVREFHGALGSVLSDYNFAPATDRAMMVKYVFQWLREAAHVPAAAMDTAPSVATAPFDLGRDCQIRSMSLRPRDAQQDSAVHIYTPEAAASSRGSHPVQGEKRLMLERSLR